jgi:hypothetical protein
LAKGKLAAALMGQGGDALTLGVVGQIVIQFFSKASGFDRLRHPVSSIPSLDLVANLEEVHSRQREVRSLMKPHCRMVSWWSFRIILARAYRGGNCSGRI